MPKGPSILIVSARYYADIVAELERNAIAALEAAGASHALLEAPGAFEIPGLIAYAHRASKRTFQGFVALGCVIRGETSHYDYVCGESARALMELSTKHVSYTHPQNMACHATRMTPAPLAIGYGVLTVENQEQAWARARAAADGGKDKGAEAARACLAVLAARKRVRDGV